MSGSLDAWKRSSLEVRVGVEDGVRGLVRVPLAFLVGARLRMEFNWCVHFHI